METRYSDAQRNITEISSPAILTIQMFGGFRGTFATGRSLVLPNRKDQALLAYLALHPEQPQSREKLANLLWSNYGSESARHSLRQALTSLRRAQVGEDVVVTARNQVIARANAIETDVARFLTLTSSPAHRLAESAVDLYAGPLLDGLLTGEGPYEEWLAEQRERLRELAVGRLEAVAESHRLAGQYGKAMEYQRRLMLIDPYNEQALRASMQLLVQTGRDLEALRNYQEFTELLERDLGVQPELHTRNLYLGIVKGRLGRGADDADAGSPSPISLVDAFRSLDGFVLWDDADRFVLCNDKFRDIFSPAADLLKPGTTWQEIMRLCIDRGRFPDALTDPHKYFKSRAKRRRSGKGEAPDIRLNDGRCYRLTHRRTDNSCQIVIFTETTERASRELATRRNHHRFEALSAASVGIEEVDSDGVLTYCNAAFAKLLGYGEAELVGKTQSHFMVRPWIEIATQWKAVRNAGARGAARPRLAVQYVTSTGKKLDAAVEWNSVRDELGRITGYIGLVTAL